MSQQDIDIIQSNEGLATDVRRMIEQTREGVAQTVNAGMTLLYWRIGKRIQTEILNNERAEYGQEIVSTLSEKLTEEFGRGFGRRSLFNMIRFAEVYPDVPENHSAQRSTAARLLFRDVPRRTYVISRGRRLDLDRLSQSALSTGSKVHPAPR